jgi:hypothetical protein
MTVLTPEFARRILRDHPDLTSVTPRDAAILDAADAERRPHQATLLDLVRETATQCTGVERYWLGKIISEAGEFGQVAGNVECFGIDTPDHGGAARARLEDEAGDIHAALVMAVRHGVLSGRRIAHRSRLKQRKLSDPNQTDNLGRPLAPPLPDVANSGHILDIPKDGPVSDDPVPASTSIEVSARVMAELTRLTEKSDITLETLFHRLLKIEPPAEIRQDGTIGYEDPATGFILPEGFPIVRTHKGVTHRAKATKGGFENDAGAFFENLNKLNVSLQVGRPENAWNEWCFVDAEGRMRKLTAIRPLPKLRERKRGRKAKPGEI